MNARIADNLITVLAVIALAVGLGRAFNGLTELTSNQLIQESSPILIEGIVYTCKQVKIK